MERERGDQSLSEPRGYNAVIVIQSDNYTFKLAMQRKTKMIILQKQSQF